MNKHIEGAALRVIEGAALRVSGSVWLVGSIILVNMDKVAVGALSLILGVGLSFFGVTTTARAVEVLDGGE